MQYWLIAYNATCPTGKNWNQVALYGGTYCWKNSANAASVPNQPITGMASWTFTGHRGLVLRQRRDVDWKHRVYGEWR